MLNGYSSKIGTEIELLNNDMPINSIKIDREDDKIGLINERQNIICFSDEAHRTQLEHSKKILWKM